MTTSEPRPEKSSLIPPDSIPAFILVTGLFFLWGIPNNLNDVLIRQFMKSFEINRLQAGLVQSAFYLGYFLFSIPAAVVMRRFGYKTGLLTGLVLYACGTLLFLPAAQARSYSLFLIALFVIASGLGFLETGANPLIAQLGDARTAVRRLNFSQAFNPLGSITGVGPRTKEGSSLIVMAIIGGAVFTPLMGTVFEATRSMALSMFVPLGCYLVVAGYGFWGSQLVPRRRSLSLATSSSSAARGGMS